jgi:hypothetical protein
VENSPPRAVVAVSVALAVLLVAGVIVVSLVFGSREDSAQPPPRTGPVALVPIPAPAAASSDCDTAVRGLPATLPSGSATLAKAPLAEPAPQAAVAWTDQRSDPVVLRCGLDRPAELKQDTQLRVVDGVKWLPIDGADSTTWFVVDRPVYIALTVPATAGTGPLQDIATAIAKTLPQVPLRIT